MPRTRKHAASRAALFSSATDNWATPQPVYDALDTEFGFDVDVCASATNHKAPNWYGLDHPDFARRDGLARDWNADLLGAGNAWCNPPYGRTIGHWMAKAAAAAAAGTTVVSLVPARTDTAWFHNHVLDASAEIRFHRGRIKFGDATTGAPFANVVVIHQPIPTNKLILVSAPAYLAETRSNICSNTYGEAVA